MGTMVGSNHGDGDMRYETGGGNVYLALDDSRTFLEELGVVHLNRLDLRREIARVKVTSMVGWRPWDPFQYPDHALLELYVD